PLLLRFFRSRLAERTGPTLFPRARFPRRLRQPAGEEHVVFRLELFQLRLEALEIPFNAGRGHHLSPWNEKPDEWQGEPARVRNRTIVDEHFGGVRTADDCEEIAQAQRIARPEPGAITARRSAAALAKLGGAAGDVERGGELRILQAGKQQRDGERPRGRAEQRVVQIRVERGQLLRRRLLRQVRIRPEPFERTILRWIEGHGSDAIVWHGGLQNHSVDRRAAAARGRARARSQLWARRPR